MKIIALEAENIKKLVAVHIQPDGNLVQITGKNGQGKTSVLDSIWWALAGAKHIQSVPIRKGEDKARIKLDLGEIIVTRTFRTTKNGKVTSGITVENTEGAKFPSPQTILDDLLGELTFDPLAFSRMDAKGQFNTLRQFVPDVDFEGIEESNRADYSKRTDINRRAKETRVLADEIEVPPDLPDSRVEDSRLVDEMEVAAKHNSDIEANEASRKRLQGEIESIDAQMETLRTAKENKAAELKAIPSGGEIIDISDLRDRVRIAGQINKQIEERDRKNSLIADAKKLEAESQALTNGMANREEEKRRAISKAKLPVKGISFGDDEILLNDVPFNQASDAEQLRVSISMAMAMNPKLRVIRVRDGSLLDEDSMKILGEMADGEDYQVWIERVDGSGKTGFILEDGHLK